MSLQIVYFGDADGKDSGETYTIFLDSNPATPRSQRFVAFVRHPMPFPLAAPAALTSCRPPPGPACPCAQNDQVYHSEDGFAFTLASTSKHLDFSDTQQAGFWDASVSQYRIFFRTHNPGPQACPGQPSRLSISSAERKSPHSGSWPKAKLWNSGGSHAGRSIGTLLTANMSAPDWGPGDHAAGQSKATIFNVDGGDNACMDV